MAMKRGLRVLTAAGAALLVSIAATGAAFAEKPGGVFGVHALDSPPSMSLHEEVDAVPARATERKLAEDGARPIIFYNRFRVLLGTPGQGLNDGGQQHYQQLGHGICLVEQIAIGLTAMARIDAKGR
jgi:hypothetical protein